MTTWDDFRQVCVHGIREELDSHDCLLCQEIARKAGLDCSNGKTYIFTSQKQIDEYLGASKQVDK